MTDRRGGALAALLLMLLAAVATVLVPATAAAQPAADRSVATTPTTASPAADDPAAALAQQYAPVVVIREHLAACGDGEPYLPMPVDVVLGRDDVVLRGADGQVLVTAPTAADLAAAPADAYLDLPGDPLSPGCDYELWADAVSEGVPPAVYARVARDSDHPGTLALQYWFFWVFNDWNDKHEGDWEMVQLLFDADTPQQALDTGPTTVMYAQHEGGQVSAWDDPRVLRDGDHPAVYPGQGSHAAYYTQAQWFGKSAAAGFGCDNTTAPGTLLRPEIILLPEDAAAATGAQAWLPWQGRWGQREPSFNNGPTGPVTKAQWEHPVTWVQEQGRTEAADLPPLPGEATDAFCGLTAAASLLFIDLLDAPFVVGGLLLLAVVLLIALIRSTRWWPAVSDPLVRTRRAGQIVTSAARLYGSRLGLFVTLSGGLLLAAVLVSGLQAVILAPRPAGSLTDVDGTLDAWPHVAAALVSLVIGLPVAVLVMSAVAVALADISTGRSPGAIRAVRSAAARPRIWLALTVQWLVPAMLVATLLLAPVAAWLVARWAPAFAVAAWEGRGVRGSLAGAAVLTRGHRWRTLALTLLIVALAGWPGPVVGALLLLVTGIPFWGANLVAATVGALALPIAATALTLQYVDLRERAAAGQDGDRPPPPPGADATPEHVTPSEGVQP